MRSVPNTIRRAGIYYFRRAVPSALQAALHRSELFCSLKTSDAGLARNRLHVTQFYLRRRVSELGSRLCRRMATSWKRPPLTTLTLGQHGSFREFWKLQLCRSNPAQLQVRILSLGLPRIRKRLFFQ